MDTSYGDRIAAAIAAAKAKAGVKDKDHKKKAKQPKNAPAQDDGAPTPKGDHKPVPAEKPSKKHKKKKKGGVGAILTAVGAGTDVAPGERPALAIAEPAAAQLLKSDEEQKRREKQLPSTKKPKKAKARRPEKQRLLRGEYSSWLLGDLYVETVAPDEDFDRVTAAVDDAKGMLSRRPTAVDGADNDVGRSPYSDDAIYKENGEQSISKIVFSPEYANAQKDFVCAPTVSAFETTETEVITKHNGDALSDEEAEDGEVKSPGVPTTTTRTVEIRIPAFDMRIPFLAAGSTLAELARKYALHPDGPIGPTNPLIIPLSNAAFRSAIAKEMRDHPNVRTPLAPELITQLAVSSISVTVQRGEGLGLPPIVATIATLVPPPLHMLRLHPGQKPRDMTDEAWRAQEYETTRSLLAMLYERFVEDRMRFLRNGVQAHVSRDFHTLDATLAGEAIVRRRRRDLMDRALHSIASKDDMAVLRREAAAARKGHSVARPPVDGEADNKKGQPEEEEEDEDKDERKEDGAARPRRVKVDRPLWQASDGVADRYHAYVRLLCTKRRYKYQYLESDVRQRLRLREEPWQLQVFQDDDSLSTLARGTQHPREHYRLTSAAQALQQMGETIRDDQQSVALARSLHCVDAKIFDNQRLRALTIAFRDQLRDSLFKRPTEEYLLSLIECVHPAISLEQFFQLPVAHRVLYVPMPDEGSKRFFPSGRFPTPLGEMASRTVADRLDRAVQAAVDRVNAEADAAKVAAEKILRKHDPDARLSDFLEDRLRITFASKADAEKLMVAAAKAQLLADKEVEVRLHNLHHINDAEVERYHALTPNKEAWTKPAIKDAVQNTIKLPWEDALNMFTAMSQMLGNHDTVLNLANDNALFLMIHPVVDVPAGAAAHCAPYISGHVTVQGDYAE